MKWTILVLFIFLTIFSPGFGNADTTRCTKDADCTHGTCTVATGVCDCTAGYTGDKCDKGIDGAVEFGNVCMDEDSAQNCKPNLNLVCKDDPAVATQKKCQCADNYAATTAGGAGKQCMRFTGDGALNLNGLCKAEPANANEKCRDEMNMKCNGTNCVCKEGKVPKGTTCGAPAKPKPPPTRERQEKKEKETPTSAAVTPIASKILPFFMAMLVVCFFI